MSPLLSGASGRLWLASDGHGRIELQSDAGDAQIVWGDSKVSVYDASSNTAYVATLPPSSTTQPGATPPAPPSLDQITNALAKLEQHANVSDATPGVIATEPSYSVSVSPKANGGLVGGAQLAWDATYGVPLRIAITAKGDPSPVLELAVTDISFDAVPSSDTDLAPPAGAKIVDLGSLQKPGGSQPGGQPVTGIDAVRAAAPFPVVAPDSVGGRPLTSARLLGQGVLLTYGDGLGALVVHEHAGTGPSTSALGALPTVSLGAVSAHELETPLGTALAFQHDGVSFVVGGSMTGTDAEAAARAFV
jgi:outer membrane lipoprotein-sorting protein